MARPASLSAELLLVVGGVAALSSVAFACRIERRARDAVLLDAPPRSVAVGELLSAWSRRLGTRIRVEDSAAAERIEFATLDVLPDWDLTRRILDFHDIVLDDPARTGDGVLVARRRRNTIARSIPPGFGPPPSPRLVTSVIQILGGGGNDIFATVRGLVTRDVNRVGNLLYVRGPEIILIVDTPERASHFERVIRMLDRQRPGDVVRVQRLPDPGAARRVFLIWESLRRALGLNDLELVRDGSTSVLVRGRRGEVAVFEQFCNAAPQVPGKRNFQ